MAGQNRETTMSVGDIQRETTNVLSANGRAILVYLAVFVPLSTIANWFDVDMGLAKPGDSTWSAEMTRAYGLYGLVVLLLSLAGQYLLFERLLEVRDHGSRALRTFGFIGLALVSFLGVGLASVFLLVPGLFVGSRWLMSPAFYVSDGEGVFASLRSSWEETKGHTGTIMLAIFLLIVIALVVIVIGGGIVGSLGYFAGAYAAEYFTDALFSELWTVVLMATSVGTYRLLASSTAEIAETFA